MSNVLKLNKKTKLNIQVSDEFLKEKVKIPSQEEIMKNKIQEAFNDGYQKGAAEKEQELIEQFNAQLGNISREIKKFFENLEIKLDEYEKNLSKNVFYLSVKIAEKIIGREIREKTIIEVNIEKALKKIAGGAAITIRINPKELELVKKKLDDEPVRSFDKIHFEPDERIAPGECILESQLGNVDTRIDSQIEEIVKSFEQYFQVIK